MAKGEAGTADVFGLLGFPEAARVDQRLPKSAFEKVLAPAAKRALAASAASLRLACTLAPGNTGLDASLRDGIDSSTFAAVSFRPRPGTAPGALRRGVAAVHGAMPYPVLVVVEPEEGPTSLSLAVKRLGTDGRHVVLEGEPELEPLPPEGEVRDGFFAAAALQAFTGNTLWLLHDWWLGLLPALAAARETGSFRVPENPAVLRGDLDALADLDAAIRSLKREGRSGASIAERIQLEDAIKSRRRERDALLEKISTD